MIQGSRGTTVPVGNPGCGGGVRWHARNQTVADHTDAVIADEDRLEGVAAIGVDEKPFLNATKDRPTPEAPVCLEGLLPWTGRIRMQQSENEG